VRGSKEVRVYVADSVRLTTEGARRVLAAGIEAAEAEGVAVSVVVVDAGGHVLVVERMDAAAAHTVHSASTKAACAASMRKPTGLGGTSVDLGYGLGIALAAGDGRWTPLPGGAPVRVRGECVGAVGVSGAPGDVDERIASEAAGALG
jgi:uncharacterized protein GlcG (DUF336 family)